MPRRVGRDPRAGPLVQMSLWTVAMDQNSAAGSVSQLGRRALSAGPRRGSPLGPGDDPELSRSGSRVRRCASAV